MNTPCEHRYVIRGNAFCGYSLECHKCGKFYGRIMEPRDLRLYQQLARRDGEIDLDAIDWGSLKRGKKGRKRKQNAGPRSLWREVQDGVETDNLS